jgi:hypothetical protein
VLLWNFGRGADAYPVRWDGYGASPIGYALGWIDSPAHANPLGWLAIPIVLGALAGLVVWVRRSITPARILTATGALLWASLFASRFFADNYLAVPVLLLACPLLEV